MRQKSCVRNPTDEGLLMKRRWGGGTLRPTVGRERQREGERWMVYIAVGVRTHGFISTAAQSAAPVHGSPVSSPHLREIESLISNL